MDNITKHIKFRASFPILKSITKLKGTSTPSEDTRIREREPMVIGQWGKTAIFCGKAFVSFPSELLELFLTARTPFTLLLQNLF